jgi:hypothetical protein
MRSPGHDGEGPALLASAVHGTASTGIVVR